MDKQLNTYQEIERKVAACNRAKNNYQTKKNQLIRFILDLGYEYYDNIHNYGEVLISHRLLESEDWAEYAHFDDEDGVWYIDELVNRSSLAVYDDPKWVAKHHIIEL